MANEIFLQPELEELVIDADKKTEWETKINQLGLTGQLSLTKNSENGSASPYTFMNEQMKLVFETLCPTKVAVEKYNKSVIPIEVLSHIALCKQEGYFKKLEIWYDNKTPDPVLVGYVSDSYSSSIIHLIARWGDEIIPYELLVEKAIKRYTAAFKLSVAETKNECESLLSSAELTIKQLFAGQKRSWDMQPKFNLQLSSTEIPF
jgi:hypothetical protein